MKPPRGLFALLLVSLMVLTAACSGSAKQSGAPASGSGQPTAEPAGKPQAGGTLSFALADKPQGVDPQVNGGATAEFIISQLYRGLLGFDRQGNLVPELAEKWEVIDAKTYVFKLRDAKFASGNSVTAADVKWSLERIDQPAMGFYLKGPLGLASLETPDPKTVKVTLKQPNALFLFMLARYYETFIVEAEWGKTHDLKTQPMGAGPYQLASYDPDTKVVLKRNPHYYKAGMPYLDQLVFVPYMDEDLRVTALRSGDVNLSSYVPAKDVAALSKSPDLVISETQFATSHVMFYNLNRPLTQSKLFRQAMAYALNRDAVVKASFAGRGTAISGPPVPKTSKFYHADTANVYTYNPEKAKQLLKEAGYKGEEVTILSTTTYKFYQLMAEVAQQSLKDIGVNVKLDLRDWAGYLAASKEPVYDISFWFWGPSPDPGYDFVSRLSSTSTFVPGLKNARIDELGRQIYETTDEKGRDQVYREVEKILIDEVPLVGVEVAAQAWGMRKNVKDFAVLEGMYFQTPRILEGSWLGK